MSPPGDEAVQSVEGKFGGTLGTSRSEIVRYTRNTEAVF